MSLEQLNFVVLSLTLLVLCFYAFDTHRIANQTIEVNLRPVILRSGWILDWNIQSVEEARESGVAKFLQFENQKNIAKDISGYVILDKKKYHLYFGNIASVEKTVAGDGSVKEVGMMAPKWGWLPPGSNLSATYLKSNYEETDESNQIYLEYKDIEGNSYFTKEDSNFSQTSGSL